eukprot:TRINITY_DN43072_c0_g1_i1.p1 TRINITY_DN43072_c0_g1~~TRINITY_DN43072_c0_g1_i1.p1  ORF type:complete len:314 (-),score=58.00 TRINITY_DN43072_c0_g1_i1:72-1013(-)
MLEERCGSGAKPCSAVELKAVPPNARPCPGKRRPRPGSLGCARAQLASPRLVPPAAAQQEKEVISAAEVNSASAAEVARLRSLVLELTARCENQEKEIGDLRARLDSSPPLVAAEVQQQDVEVVDHKDGPSSTCEAEAQTNPSESKDAARIERSDSGEVEAQQREQLEFLHREVGDKGRELRKAQDTVRLLRTELTGLRQVSDHYKSQVEMLEEQLTSAQTRLKSAAQQQSHSQDCGTPRSSGGSRPSSARIARAWQGQASPRSRGMSIVAPVLPSMVGSSTPRSGSRTHLIPDSDGSAEEDSSTEHLEVAFE